MPDRVISALTESLRARPEIAERPERCRAILNDTLAGDSTNARREVALLVGAVEDGIPRLLTESHTHSGLDEIVSRFESGRGLTNESARWAVEAWVSALRATGASTVPGPVATPVDPIVGIGDPDTVPQSTPDHRGSSLPSTVPDGWAEHSQPPARIGGDLTPVSTDEPPVKAARRTPVLRQMWTRSPLAVGAAAVVLVVAVAAGAVAAAGHGSAGGAAPTTTAKSSTTSSTTVTVTTVAGQITATSSNTTRLPDGLKLARTWQLSGQHGNRFMHELVFTNPTHHTITNLHTEVIPKTLARSVDNIVFTPKPGRYLASDPIVLYRVTVPPGRTRTLVYQIKVLARGATKSRLRTWIKDATKLEAAYLRSIEPSRPTPTTSTTTTTTTIPHGGGNGGPPTSTCPNGTTVNVGQTCPTTKAPPDHDGDRIPDATDQCRTIPFPARAGNTTGCPPPTAGAPNYPVEVGDSAWYHVAPNFGWHLEIGKYVTVPDNHPHSDHADQPSQGYATVQGHDPMDGYDTVFFDTCYNSTFTWTFRYTVEDLTTHLTASNTVTVTETYNPNYANPVC